MGSDLHQTGWRKCTLGDVIELKRGYDLPKRMRQPGPFPIVSSSGPSGWHARAKVAGPGVVTGRYGTIGKVFFIEGDFWPLNTALYVRDFKGADPRFVSYFLRSVRWGNFTDKAAVPGVNRNHVHTEPVVWPPLPEQRRIATVLGALDDKIELNRKMNQTLEAMVQALFKSWFVDFDPVIDNALRAGKPIPDDLADKAERRHAVMAREDYAASEYAALFPDAFVESELGSIPRGWFEGTLGDVALQHRESTDPTTLPTDTPYFGLADMPEGSFSLSTWGVAGDAKSNKSAYRVGDILFGKLRPYFKKVGVAPNDGVCSSDILVIRPKESDWWGFTLGLLTHDPFIDFTTSVSTGTRMPRVSWKNMRGYSLALPPAVTAKRFNLLVRGFVDKVIANNSESRTLATLRDTLLPKLISGELRVPEIEGLLDEATP